MKEIYQYKNIVHVFLFCTMINKRTIISQIITLLHVSTLSCHPQGACNKYLVKLPEGAIGTSHGKTHIFKTRVRKVETSEGK